MSQMFGSPRGRLPLDVLHQGLTNQLEALGFEAPISDAELPFFAVILSIGFFLSFFGHKLKKSVLFVTGALLPVFLYTVNFLPENPPLKIIIVVVLGLCAGIFFVKYPKCGLAGVGIVWGAAMGRFLFFLLQSILKDQVFTPNKEAINVGCIAVSATAGGLLVAGCFSKLYCLVIPFVGAVLGADALAHVLIIVAHKYWKRIRGYFPLETPLLINHDLEDSESLHKYLEELKRSGEQVFEDVSSLFGAGDEAGAATSSSSSFRDFLHQAEKSLVKYRYPWGIWAACFVFCFIVGVKLQCREYRKEKREKQRLHLAEESSDEEPLLAHPAYRSRPIGQRLV
ncbi:unnamed protein product [Amoebophrya sp. A120]|nr:unnamed protein product [Amoebophrya sp. A120]|eukprot:GSA120T00021589001.1